MTRVADQARFLRWLTADGPFPVRAGLEALASNGFDTRNRWRLNRAKQEAGVVSRRNGYGPGASFFWQVEIDHTPLPETPDIWGICTTCRYSLWLPATTLPRPCVTTAQCPGLYQPAPAMTPPNIETRMGVTSSNASNWRSKRSPLRR
jgi:hypothetical protein